MPVFTGKALNLSFQRALEEAVRQALVHKVEDEHEMLKSFEVTRIYGARTESTGFNMVCVDIEVK
jgi:acyl-CoA hydrolase